MNTKKISIQLSDEYLVIKIPKSEINFPNIELPKLELFCGVLYDYEFMIRPRAKTNQVMQQSW